LADRANRFTQWEEEMTTMLSRPVATENRMVLEESRVSWGEVIEDLESKM
jgi:hypothetical protein